MTPAEKTFLDAAMELMAILEANRPGLFIPDDVYAPAAAAYRALKALDG